MRSLRLALLVALALPGTARAADAVLVARELPVGKARALASAAAPIRFDLVGLHWQGPGSVSFRTRSLDGSWGPWRVAAPEAEDLPDRGSSEARASGAWRLGNPYWVGPSSRIEWRLRGTVRRLRAYYVWSRAGGAPPRTLSTAGSPPIVPRLSWNADESIRRAAPAYAPAVRFALVHHTAGSNSYTPAQSAAIVRGIEVYHVKGNGWNDIGYNFLVDRYGHIFEGRYGGVDRNVVGAHAEGFNTGSVGVALIGSYGSAPPPAVALSALARLLAWRLDVAHIDPLTTLSWISAGNPRFPAGVPVFLRTISGHRDTGFTDCPGSALYARLNDLAGQIGQIGLPKLYDVAVRNGSGGRVRFTGRLSAALPWTVKVTDKLGQDVAEGTGTAASVDWTWDASHAALARYAWTIDAGPRVRPASGTVGAGTPAVPPPPPPLIGDLVADPDTVAPTADGQQGATTVSYVLGAAAMVTATVLADDGTVLGALFNGEQPAGPQSLSWDAGQTPDGRYRIQVVAVAPATTETGEVAVLVDRTLTAFQAAPTVFSPNGDNRAETITFSFFLSVPAPVRLRVATGDGRWVATPFDGTLQLGPQLVVWDGKRNGAPVPDGTYRIEASAVGLHGPVTVRSSFAIDTTPPFLTIVSGPRLDLYVDEAATVVLNVDGKRIVKVRSGPGAFHVPHSGAPSRVTALAWDAAGNSSGSVRWP